VRGSVTPFSRLSCIEGEGNFNISYHNISLIKNDATQDELLVNGGVGSDKNWTNVKISGNIAFEYNYNSTNPKERFYRSSGSSYANGAVYQPVTLIGGQRYTLGGVFKEYGKVKGWAEVYLLETEPRMGVDITRDHKMLHFKNECRALLWRAGGMLL
jgi:hypothetical protein